MIKLTEAHTEGFDEPYIPLCPSRIKLERRKRGYAQRGFFTAKSVEYPTTLAISLLIWVQK